MAKTKILYFITALDQGGAQNSVLTTIKRLDKREFEAHLAAGPGGRLDGKAKRELKNLYFISALRHDVRPRYFLHDAVAVVQMGWLMRRLRPDIIHTNAPKAGVLGRLAARIFWRKAKVVHTFHGLGFAKEHGEKHFNFFVKTEKFCAKLTDVLVFVSKKNAQEAAQLGIGAGVHSEIIRAGIDFERKLPAKFDPGAKKASLKIPRPSRVVLAIANFKPLKNPIHFVLAAYKVLSQIKNVCFIYTGEGPLKTAAANLAKHLGIEKQVLLPGWRGDTDELLAIADVYASTSLREGVPMSLLEAQAHRVPCVCYDVDGISEVLTNNRTGFLVKVNDITALAEKIKTLLRNNGLRERFKQNIARRDFGEFTVSVMIRRQEQLYRSLVPQKRPGRRFFHRRKALARRKFHPLGEKK
ncbi:glycosyltransferase family 4 protein [Candidatus Avelusimicrobium facis]|uniref:glycosyltransferase family 4 protein n=1 Tax=Candidatus Avelusimicrobium facis TaxID=3416203 RepID=UPI003D12573E